jgi:hypothetical protein
MPSLDHFATWPPMPSSQSGAAREATAATSLRRLARWSEIEAVLDGVYPVVPMRRVEVFDAGAVPWKQQPVHVIARTREFLSQVADLVGRAREAMHAHHSDLSISDEIERVPNRHKRWGITPVRTLLGTPRTIDTTRCMRLDRQTRVR